MKRNERRHTKKELETKMSQNDSAVHFSLRQSYSSRQVQRMALSFETFEEAKERAKTTPPKVRERSHTASPANIEGKLDQLLADVKLWPDGPPNWSEKARMYNIKTKGSDSTPGNGGQLVKAFLKSKKVDITQFKPPSEVHLNSEDGLTGKKSGKFVTKPTVESYISAISFISERNCVLGLNKI